MNHEVKILHPAKTENWDNIIHELGGSIFHTANWCEVLSQSYNYRARYFGIFDHDQIVGVVPVMEIDSFITGKRGVSLPFSDYCFALFPDKVDVQAVLSDIADFGKKSGWKSIEFRGLNYPGGNEFVSDSYYVHQIDLKKPFEEVVKTFRRQNRMNIKKAVKNNIRIKIENTREAITKFYQLNCKNKKKNGVPPAPLHFYQKIYEYVISEGLGNIFVAKLADKTISMGMAFQFGDQVLLKYMAQDYQYHQYRPNNLLIHDAIKHYAGSTWKTFCFGRTGMDNEGLCQFKKGWGTNVDVINYYNISLEKKTKTGYMGIYKNNKKYFSKMPLWMLKMVGNMMYKHIG